MKTLRILFSAAAIIAAVSCNKEMQEPQVNQEPEVAKSELIPMTFTATTTETRTTLDGVSINWLNTDKISVFDGEGNREFTSSGEGTTVQFSGNASQADNYYALYPYNETASFDGTNLTVSTTLAANQTPTPGTFANGLNINAAKSTDNTTFHFTNVLSVAKFTLSGSNLGGKSIKSVKFGSTHPLAGDVVITYGETITASAGSNTVKEITLANEDGSALADGTYYFVVLPNNGGAITMTFEATDGCTASVSATLGSAFSAGVIKNLGTVQGLTWEPIVENFNSSVVQNNSYNSNYQLSVENNRNGFDYSWTPAGKGNLFTNGIKLGGGTDEGSITSSDILSSISAGSTFTVNVYAAVWRDDGGKLVVSYNGIDIEEAPANDPITATTGAYSEDDFTLPTSFVFTKTAEAEDLTIASSYLRILIDKVEIVLGGTPVPVEILTVTPDESNPEIVPVEGAVMNYTVSTTNIDSWDVTSSNSTDFVAEKTADGFKVTVSANEGYTTRSATITVTGGTKTKTVTINQAANVNSIDNPYTVAEALSMINDLDDNDETANVFTTGTIIDIESIDTGEYKNASYTISDGESSIYVYRGKYLDNAGFTTQDQIKLGDVVVVYGKLKKYVNNNSVVTPEIAQGNYIAQFISRAPYFTVALNGESEISHTGGSRTLTIKANVAWTASIDNNATLKLGGGTASASVSGTEDATVTVSIPENTEAKTYTITFSTTSTEVQTPAAITISQTAAPMITGIAVEGYTATYSVSTGSYSFNGKVYALYSDNTRVEIPATDYEIDGTVDLSTAGEYDLTVTYLTYSKTITISVTNMDYQASATLASWVFTSESYPANKANFAATSGVCNESTFYLNGSGSTWNANKGYAFTSVTNVTITVKAVKPLKAGSTLTLSMDTFYNKASNAPMTGFSIKAGESGGTSSTTGLSVTSWTLSTSSATKTVTYTVQNDVAAGDSVVFILTGTGKAGAGQGYINDINAVFSTTE